MAGPGRAELAATVGSSSAVVGLVPGQDCAAPIPGPGWTGPTALFRTRFTGTALRDHYGLPYPENQFTAARGLGVPDPV